MTGFYLMAKKAFLSGLGFLLAALSLAAALPDLVQLKMAAEAGGAVAQFEYGQRINDRTGKTAWFLKSAQHGYAPAQDALAAIYAGTFTSNQKEKRALNRDAVRWASRAAYQGMSAAQFKLSGYYEGGAGVAKNPVAAYMWLQIAVLTSGGEHGQIFGSPYKVWRDQLV